jgi:hypothetical protein
MAAAALNWIHETSKDQEMSDRWNNAKLSDRAKLLKAASRDPYQKHLSWEALEELVRADVIYAIKRQEKNDQEFEAAVKAEAAKRATHHHPIAANDPRLWWNQD